MRMLIVGAGAIGGFYGAHLAKAGRDVTFLVRPRRAEQLRQSGLQLKSPKGNISIAPKLVTADRQDGGYDIILVAVKAFSLEAVMADMAPAVGSKTMILAPLNGMKHIDLLSARFGKKSCTGLRQQDRSGSGRRRKHQSFCAARGYRLRRDGRQQKRAQHRS